MKRTRLNDIDTTNLNVVEVTEGVNGYPKNIQCALIGFETYEEAEKMAEEYGLEVRQLRARDGWQFYEDRGPMYRAFDMESIYDAECDYRTFTNDEAEGYFEEQKELLADLLTRGEMKNYDEIRRFIDRSERNFDRINDAEDDELVVLYEGIYRETVKKIQMSYREDVWSYVIGVM